MIWRRPQRMTCRTRDSRAPGGRGRRLAPALAQARRFAPETGVETPNDRPRGWFPQIFLVGSFGLALVAVGGNGSRVGDWWGEPLFWLGLSLIFGATALRLLMAGVARAERVALVAFVGVALFIAKHLSNPLAFERFDEMQHIRTLDDIVSSQRLFVENPLLPISPYYPGLEVVTSALVQLAGMPYVSAGAVILATSRLALVVGLFLIYERITASARIASIGALIYMANPNFVYFNGSYAYESLAIPLGVALIFLVVRQSRHPLSTRSYTSVVVILSTAVAITHHVTSLALGIFLVAWALLVVLPLRAWRSERRFHVVLAAAIFTGITLAWSLGVAGLLLDYLAPVVESAISGLIGIITGSETPRQPFVSAGGVAQPLWSRLLGLAAPMIVTLLLPVGLVAIWRAIRRRPPVVSPAPAALLGLVALAYPASLAFRLTSGGAAQASSRSAEFVFLGVGLVAAMALVGVLEFVRRFKWSVVAASLCLVMFLGGVILGTPDWARLPRPYVPGADARSVEVYGLSLARWAKEHLGTTARIAGDRVNRLLIGAYGGNYTVSQTSTGVAVWPLFFATELEGRPEEIVREARVEYVIVDTRLVGAVTPTSVVESGEQFRLQQGPISPAAAAKWTEAAEVSRVYDNGQIYVYDLRQLHAER